MSNFDLNDFNRNLIADLRAHGGRATGGPFEGRPVLILTTTGAKTGELRESPLVYSQQGDRLVIAASKAGADTHPAWYHNLVANPEVTVEVLGERYAARAKVYAEANEERRRIYDEHAKLGPAFKEYEAKTSRVIPAVALERVRQTA